MAEWEGEDWKDEEKMKERRRVGKKENVKQKETHQI